MPKEILTMKYTVKKLIADGDRIRATDGEYICSISMTAEAKALLDNEGWDKGKESWLDYRERTQRAREDEQEKRRTFSHDLVTAYNHMMEL
jgi:hypothetical protein